MVKQPALVDLYNATPRNPPLPSTHTIYSCPSCPAPNDTYAKPPDKNRAFFMYGETGRICINRSSRGGSNTKLSLIPKPSDTILVAEVDPNSPQNTGPAQSNCTGQYAVGRHETRGNFAMADGSARSARTNDFMRTPDESNNGFSPPNTIALEWQTERKMYWYPTPTTPN
jgi:prepilin-type processing-associated H-X9-DG protein